MTVKKVVHYLAEDGMSFESEKAAATYNRKGELTQILTKMSPNHGHAAAVFSHEIVRKYPNSAGIIIDVLSGKAEI